MKGRTTDILASLYVIGILIDWTYWIAIGWELRIGEINHGVPVILGWVPAIVWPLHLFVKIWDWILGI